MLFLCVNIQRPEESRCVQANNWFRFLQLQNVQRKGTTRPKKPVNLVFESDQSGDEVSNEESELSCSWMEETLLLTSKYFIIIYNL